MNQLATTINDGHLTMSSREIAQVVESRHDKVKQSIERLSQRGLVSFTPVGEKSDTGRPGVVYHVSKRDSYVIVAQLSPEFTARLVDRWQELEAQALNLPDFSNPAIAARAWADEVEKSQTLQIENQKQAAQIESLQNLFVDGMTPTEFAKRLNGVNCQKANQALANRKWLYQDFGGGWRVSSYARDRYLTERQSNIQRNSGQVVVCCTPVLLRKGAIQMHKFYLAGELPMKQTWNGQFTHDKAMQGAA
ncbi:Rha family transcriptional regulator [Marinobacter subterrani]|uniref:Phage regulatory protein Rha n=1 Tax=Marinobacter subterrani TaxID=1658765 RepID=A0A0J7JBU3_9GAMM|nr:Rha family transcriptional regulator [Marinobacter subterrani]KMQ75281.1 Phage regulatory protein Rha [Marinobacter subterrani]